jgi:hypothetical protein
MILQSVWNECIRFGGHVNIQVSYKILEHPQCELHGLPPTALCWWDRMESLPTRSNGHHTCLFNFKGPGSEVLFPVLFSPLPLIPSLAILAWSSPRGGYIEVEAGAE